MIPPQYICHFIVNFLRKMDLDCPRSVPEHNFLGLKGDEQKTKIRIFQNLVQWTCHRIGREGRGQRHTIR